MKLSFALMLVPAVLLAGCSRPVVKETIVERPVVQERVVERQVPVPAAGATGPAACTFASQSYSHGALSCQDRTEFKCDNGTWRRTFTAC